MNKTYKLMTLVLSLCCLALIAASLWLYARTPHGGPDAVPSPAAVQTSSDSQGTGPVVIREFMAKNRAVLRDEDGDFSDWIELQNLSSETVSLSGWTLSDEPGPGWTLPEVSLAPGEYLLVFASGKGKRGGELHTDFSLSAGETIYLRNADDALVDEAACGDAEADVSVVRGEDGTLSPCLYPTPGFENSTAGYLGFQDMQLPAGPLVINEVMVSNQGTYTDSYRGACDWVEIKNISSDSVSLSDYFLSDDHKDYTLWRLPNKTLAPGRTILILCDGEAGTTPGGTPCAPFSLSDSGDRLFLSSEGGLIDWASLRDIPSGCSFGRMDAEPGWYYFASPSPGESNRGGGRYIASAPEGLTADGVYDGVDSVTVELASAPGQTLRYTLDGSLPTARSREYTGPITLRKTTVLRAVCFEDAALPSRALTQTFVINEGHTLPVLSLATDSVDDFDTMYWGKHKGIELPASLSLYELDGGGFTIGCGVSMNGETSLEMAKKNMSVRFRGAYGADTLQYDIYGGGVTEFTNLLLRAGQDFTDAIVRNELCQELCAQAGAKVINQRSIWCVLYINGEYSGLYTLKEKANEALYASLAGVSRDSVTVLEANVPRKSSLYQDVIDFCVKNDMSLPENYEHICSLIDIDSVIDWVIMESFCANVDLTAGNLRYCRSTENDGKWRLMFYDLDSTFRTTGGVYGGLISDYAKANRQVSTMLVPLMDNDEYRDRFLRRAAELMGSALTNEAVLAELDAQSALIAPEVERDYARFGKTLEQWEWSKQRIRNLINNKNWRQYNIDALCRFFSVNAEERAEYFGEIDGK